MYDSQADFTRTFRALSTVDPDGTDEVPEALLREVMRRAPENESAAAKGKGMQSPVVELIANARPAGGDASGRTSFGSAASGAGDEGEWEGLRRRWAEWVAKYRAALRAEGRSWEERRREQDSANPMYIPRNWLAQVAIEAAEVRGGRVAQAGR